MLKEALSMILGPCLIFCINYIQRKLKRCFSRAPHFLGLHYTGKSTMEKLNYTSSAVFSVVLSWGEGQLLGFCSSIPESPEGQCEGQVGSHTATSNHCPHCRRGGSYHRGQHVQRHPREGGSGQTLLWLFVCLRRAITTHDFHYWPINQTIFLINRV